MLRILRAFVIIGCLVSIKSSPVPDETTIPPDEIPAKPIKNSTGSTTLSPASTTLNSTSKPEIVKIICEFKLMKFNENKEIRTCIPKPFVIENATNYPEFGEKDENCAAFYANNSESLFLPLGLSNFLPNLEFLTFKESKLIEIHNQTLKDLTKLTEVNLNKNSLTKIDAGIFRDNKLLRKINLSANKIESVHVDAFKGLKALEEIYLNDNELESLDAELFRDNLGLLIIDLELNGLKTLPMTIFHGLSNLNSLNLNNNQLEALPGRIFNDSTKLEILKFSENLVNKTDVQNMEFFNNLDTIEFDENPCTAELRNNADNEEIKNFLDENCKVECKDELEWIKSENWEMAKRYARILEELKNLEDPKNNDEENSSSKTTEIP